MAISPFSCSRDTDEFGHCRQSRIQTTATDRVSPSELSSILAFVSKNWEMYSSEVYDDVLIDKKTRFLLGLEKHWPPKQDPMRITLQAVPGETRYRGALIECR